jgi:uncharacterized protein
MPALITGASGGIGEAIARELARRKIDLVLVARSADKLDQAAESLRREFGVKAHAVAADLTTTGAVADVVTRTNQAAGRIDILVNNAGFGDFGAFKDTDLTKIITMIRLNVEVLTELTHRALPDLLAAKGRVLNIASTAAFQPGPLMTVYYATKAYVLSFSEGLAEEVAAAGVTVTALCPGPTRSGFQERARVNTSARLFRTGFMTTEAVARRGVEGMFRGRRVVIPGFSNWLGAEIIRLSPRRLPPKVVRWLHQSRH